MRFLLEKLDEATKQQLDKWPRLSDADKKATIETFAKTANSNNKDLSNIAPAIERNFDMFGATERNPFYNLVTELNFYPTRSMLDNFNRLTDYQNEDKVDFNLDYLSNLTLYTRPLQDFDYTLNLFEIVSHPEELKKYFTDTTNIDIYTDLYGSSGNIKPVGSDKDSNTATLKGTVNNWHENNSIPKSETESEYKYTLTDFLRHFNVPQNLYLEGIKRIIDKYVEEDKEKKQSLKILSDISKTNKKVKFTQKQKDSAEKYTVLYPEKAAPKDLRYIRYPKSPKNGDIVFAYFDNQVPVDEKGSVVLDDSHQLQKYFIYMDGEWIPERSVLPTTDKERSAQQYLLGTKILDTETNKRKAAYEAKKLLVSPKMKEYLQKGDDISNYL